MADRERVGRRRVRWWLAALLALVVALAVWPSSRYVGIDFVVRRETLPIWVKAVNFIDRDVNLSRLSREVVGGFVSDEARAFAAFDWTRVSIRPRPDSLPIVDDHVWHIVVRGYGQPDQQADVFTTLLVYGGVPAFWGLIGQPPVEQPLSYVRVDGRWRVFDVAAGIVFRREDGQLATPEEIAADPGIVRRAAVALGEEAAGYVALFSGYRPPRVPDVLRADLHRPGSRLVFETRRLVGARQEVWQMRPHDRVPPQENRR